LGADVPIMADTVVQAVVKANRQSNEHGQFSNPMASKSPEQILMKHRIYTVSQKTVPSYFLVEPLAHCEARLK